MKLLGLLDGGWWRSVEPPGIFRLHCMHAANKLKIGACDFPSLKKFCYAMSREFPLLEIR